MIGEPVDLACTRCALARGRTQVVPGKGPAGAKLVLVGEAPGGEEDKKGEPFVGRAGALLDGALEEAGLASDQVFITNVVKCRPPSNRRPKIEERAACRPFLDGEIDRCGASVLVALGGTAAEALAGRKIKVSETSARSVRAPLAGQNREIFATLHPASSRFRKGAQGEIARALAAAAERAGIPRREQGVQRRL